MRVDSRCFGCRGQEPALPAAVCAGQRDFDLADALDDPEPTKKPSSDIYPRPKPPYHPQPGMPDNSGGIYPRPKPPYHPQPGMPDNNGGIYPRPKPPYHPQPGMPDNSGGIYPRPRPPPRPQPGGSDSGGGYFGNRDQDDGRYPPRPRPPAAGGGGYYPNNDGHGNAYGTQVCTQVVRNRAAHTRGTAAGESVCAVIFVTRLSG
ncbi:glycoprotein Xg isoform X2 [Panthera tigris]|uniref:glycoprotein Xg isoform X2 n=1 Tax=Panthera tigris TaxID=9694 RepID=UPI001C6F6B11|nr:glycoprotein Xg isoform X2 [Panthera tigris]